MTPLPKIRDRLIADPTVRGALLKTLYELNAAPLWIVADAELQLELRGYRVGGRLLVVWLSLDTGGWELLTPLCEKLEIDLNLDALRAYAARKDR